MNTYTAGTITVAKNALKVYGQNTAWLVNDIKKGDLIVINSSVYEIEEVNTSTELTLANAYTGNNVSTAAYVIVRVAEQVLAADIASLLYQHVTNYETLIETLGDEIEVLSKARLYIDTDGDVAQSDE